MDLSRKQAGRAEFERFVADHGPGLMRTAYLITWDEAEAEDLVQECLLRVAKRWPKVRSLAHPVAYARRVLVNHAPDGGSRRQRRGRELSEPPGAVNASLPRTPNRIDVFETRDELLRAIGTLPPRQRAVLVLRYFEDLSEAQVAEVLGCSRGTVKSTASRGLARVREVMETDEVSSGAPGLKQRQGGQISGRAT